MLVYCNSKFNYAHIAKVLWERGKYVEGMKGKQTEDAKDTLRETGKAHLIVPDDLDAHAVLAACPDFLHERTALETMVTDRGHILLASVVCTPETAGGGLEYGWGKLKYAQRQANEGDIKLESGAKFHAKIKSLCADKTLLPMSRVWKYQRRARDYIRLYMSSPDLTRVGEGESSSLTFLEIETMRKKAKTHRNIMVLERAFILND